MKNVGIICIVYVRKEIRYVRTETFSPIESNVHLFHSVFIVPKNLGSIHDQAKDTIYERKLYEKLKALNKYQKRNGVEAILYKKFLEKRQRVS